MLGQIKEKIKKWRFQKRRRSTKGQALSEYGAIIAFIAIIIALTFSFTSGSLGPALSAAFSSIASNVDKMSATAANSSS